MHNIHGQFFINFIYISRNKYLNKNQPYGSQNIEKRIYHDKSCKGRTIENNFHLNFNY